MSVTNGGRGGEHGQRPGSGESSATLPLLQVENVGKTFGSVVALQGASLSAQRGEITAIIGDNGAGKSTLIKCISGVHPHDRGEIRFDGSTVSFSSPEVARSAGIETVYQNLALVDDLTIWQNLFLNRELKRGIGPIRFLDRRAMAQRSKEMLSRLDIHIPSVEARVRRLSGGQRQAVAISRATGWGSRLIIMDEPTAALGHRESSRVEELILRLRDEGLSILVISHNFDQVLRISDQVWVMRQGRVTGERRTKETTGDELVAMVTGAAEERPGERESRG
ncbi:MAG: ATP-binding cassette domain-containing protein [Actinomycetota bacterium]|nr:ATP-binding cassette domain-containing protein [Actinomycetota bacterium]